MTVHRVRQRLFRDREVAQLARDTDDAIKTAVAAASADHALSLPLAGGRVTGRFGQVPQQFFYSAAVTLDLSQNNTFLMMDSMTADMTIELARGRDGDSGVIGIAQDGTGGWKITDVQHLDRTVLMRDDLTTINTTPMLVASAKSFVAYELATVGGLSICFLSIVTGITAGFG